MQSKLPSNCADIEPECSESEEDETFCFFCSEAYTMSANEGWICRRWEHDDCAGIDDGDDNFVCDICAQANYVSSGHHHIISWLPDLR